MARTALALALAAAAATIGACGSGTARPASGSRPLVVASTNVYGSLLRAIAGDAAEVRTLVDDPSVDPHEHAATPADAAAVRRAALLVVNGGGYDTPIEDLGRDLPAGRVLRVSPTGAANEHAWYSVPTMRRAATAATAALVAAAPGSRATFEAGAARLDADLARIEARTAVARPAVQGRAVAVNEPVAGLLLDDLGVTVATDAAFGEAVEEGEDPPAAVLKAQLDLLRSRSVRALVTNAQTETPLTRQVRDEAERQGVPVVVAHELLPEGQDYVAFIDDQLSRLLTALGAPGAP